MKKNIIFMILLGAMILSICGSVAATDINATPLPNNKHIFINVSNDEGVKYNFDGTAYGGPNNTYYIKADGGGLNALHISNSSSLSSGQVTVINSQSTDSSGTFYVTDTGGKGFNDDVILLLSVKGPIPDNFTIHIRSSGYGNWTLAPLGGTTNPPTPTSYLYMEGAIDQTFNKTDFQYGPNIYKPGPGTLGTWSLPLYAGQNTTDPSTAEYLMFIDLYRGILRNSGLIDGGFTKVEYSFTNLNTTASFNIYTWMAASNQGQGISYAQDPSTSGYTINYTPPDLTVSNLQLPSNPQAGTSYPVSVTVTNNGGTGAGSFGVRLFDNGVAIQKITVPALAAGASTQVTFNWKPTTTGTHDLQVVADIYNTVLESNEANNQITQEISVTTKPDLTVSNLQLPNNPQTGTSYPVTVTVTNNGGTDAGSFGVRLFDNGVAIQKITVPALAAGASTQVTFNWKPTTTGTHDLQVTADVYNTVIESNEANNQITSQTTVITKPDLTVSNLQLPSNPTAGTSYPVSVTVTNNGGTDAGNFGVRLFDNGVAIQKINVPALAAGASTQVTFNWKPTTTGTHDLVVVADVYNTVAESNEANNQITQGITVN